MLKRPKIALLAVAVSLSPALSAAQEFGPAHAPTRGPITSSGPIQTAPIPMPAPFDVPPAPSSGLASAPTGIWWTNRIAEPLRPQHPGVQLTVEELLMRTLNCSSQVRVFSELPLIRESAIVEADSAFDWTGYFDTRWDDITDPVGNTLTIGGDGDRFEDHNYSGAAGVRKRTLSGGRLDVGQRFGWQDTNSTFFLPDQQGTSRLTLSFTQPLMRGRGRVYNESLKVLACIDASIAGSEFQRQLQSHLLEVVRAYWGLYLERGVYLQKRAAVGRADELLEKLTRRRGIDAYESQIISAEADVKQRRSELKRSAMAVRNAEDRIRSLVNDPALDSVDLELIPTDDATTLPFDVTMGEALATAIQFRPEVTQSVKQIQAAGVRVNMSKNELLPVLNLVTETYISGLEGEGQVGRAFGSQFDSGRPSYSIGLQYEVPFGNRAARARHIRRHQELRQLRNQYATTVSTLTLETRVAVRELQTSFDELDTKLSALNALQAKSNAILRRWELMPTQGRGGSYAIEALLAAQGQLTVAENDYLTSVVTYNLALMNLKRATGMLLQHEQVQIRRTTENRLPTQRVGKPYVAGMPYVTDLPPSPAPQAEATYPSDAADVIYEVPPPVGPSADATPSPGPGPEQPAARRPFSRLAERLRRRKN